MPHSRQMEEPDVTPLINVNLVILVMVLAIASHAARLLPLAVPKTDKETKFVAMDKAVLLRVNTDDRYSLQGGAPLNAEELGEELEDLPEGSILLVSPHPKAKYGALVKAVDHLLARRGLQVAFGYPGRIRATTVPAAAALPDGAAPKTPPPAPADK